jgi:hypothetical protein
LNFSKAIFAPKSDKLKNLQTLSSHSILVSAWDTDSRLGTKWLFSTSLLLNISRLRAFNPLINLSTVDGPLICEYTISQTMSPSKKTKTKKRKLTVHAKGEDNNDDDATVTEDIFEECESLSQDDGAPKLANIRLIVAPHISDDDPVESATSNDGAIVGDTEADQDEN